MGISKESLDTIQRVGSALNHGVDNVNAVKEAFSKNGDGVKATSNALNSINDFMGVVGNATKGTNAAAIATSMTATTNSIIDKWNKENKVSVSDIVTLASDLSAIGSMAIPHPAVKIGLGGLSIALAGLATVIGDDPSIPVDDIKDTVDKAMGAFDTVKDSFNDALDFVDNEIDNAINFWDDFFDGLVDDLGGWLDDFGDWIDGLISPLLYDPIALDLDGDGAISLIADKTGSVYFDHDCDGVAFRSSWISSNDGILVYDRNSNGKIDNGSELFGNFTLNSNGEFATDGFNALSDFDTNNDGIISNLDENFDKLQIWQDLNSNGISEANELKTLSELSIESINLNKFTNLNLLIA